MSVYENKTKHLIFIRGDKKEKKSPARLICLFLYICFCKAAFVGNPGEKIREYSVT